MNITDVLVSTDFGDSITAYGGASFDIGGDCSRWIVFGGKGASFYGLYLAFLPQSGGEWVQETVAQTDMLTKKITEPSLAVAPDGSVHIAWREQLTANGPYSLCYRRREVDGTWGPSEVVVAAPSAVYNVNEPVVVTDLQSNPHIFYHQATGAGSPPPSRVYRATNISGSWQTEAVTGDYCAFAKAVRDTNGDLCVAYVFHDFRSPTDPDEARLRIESGGVWGDEETLHIDNGIHSLSMALSPSGRLAVAWGNTDTSVPESQYTACFRIRSGGSWGEVVELQVSDRYDSGPFIVLDDKDVPHLLWGEWHEEGHEFEYMCFVQHGIPKPDGTWESIEVFREADGFADVYPLDVGYRVLCSGGLEAVVRVDGDSSHVHWLGSFSVEDGEEEPPLPGTIMIGSDRNKQNQANGQIRNVQFGTRGMTSQEIARYSNRTTEPRMSQAANLFMTLASDLFSYRRAAIDISPVVSDVWNFGEQDDNVQSMVVLVAIYQEGSYPDTFYIDNVGLYVDTILWEFSNDHGQTWYPIFGVMNKAWGRMVLPNESSSIRVRVSGNSLNDWVQAFSLRPIM